jgi:hypothetical protein
MKKNKTQAAAYRVASRATFNNPVSVMALGKVTAYAAKLLDNGLSEEEAILATANYIEEIVEAA